MYHLVFSECLEMLSPLNAEIGMKGIRVRLEADDLEQCRNVCLDLVVFLLVVVHGVHLVDGDDELGDAQCPGQEHVLLGLLHDAVGRCDYEDSCIGLDAPVIMFLTKSL